MKKWQGLILCIIVISFLFLSCCGVQKNGKNIEHAESRYSYSNLIDEESHQILKTALETAGVSPDSVNHLFESINKYNQAVGSLLPVQTDFEPFTKDCSYYANEAKLERKWKKAYHSKTGRKNCRITAFEAIGSLITVNENVADLHDALLPIETEDLSVFQSDDAVKKFTVLFAGVQTEDTSKAETLSNKLIDYWRSVGVQFPTSDKIAMVSILFNSPDEDYENEYILHCGHVCVMICTENDGVLVFEKLGYNFPYQLIRFPSEQEAFAYLVEFNCGEFNENTMILVNDRMLKMDNNHYVY